MAPKFVPVMITDVPTGPAFGDRLVIVGGGVGTVNWTPFVAIPFTVPTTRPVVVPAGTGTVMLLSLQDAGVAATPLNVTVLVP